MRDGQVVEADGTVFVMRGVNHPHVWYPHRTGSFADIKAMGANAVRVVLGSGQRWGPSDDLADVVARCKRHRLIGVLEVHDTTGYGDEPGAATLEQAADYWISRRAALIGQESHVVVNLGNEPFGDDPSANDTWAAATRGAVRRLRRAGLRHLVMADAPKWGQDVDLAMATGAQAVLDADPDRNTVFSVHMYGFFDGADRVRDYVDRFRAAGLALVIGEFGHLHLDGVPDSDAIMSIANTHGIGYLGWSWSGNSGGVEYLDMVRDFDPDQLTGWGERIFNGPDGIRASAREAGVYRDGAASR